jgi:hypothetical protein
MSHKINRALRFAFPAAIIFVSLKGRELKPNRKKALLFLEDTLWLS